ncbi:hypothetical protein BB934_04395 [Microvirga ossetica]|uniref:Uncharacterized protein n=1 Tax=Microvirga ossetica TaxID=1882682 RepID=A0A1B2EC73_9HYPH|nr:hypothetical protein [Microvirga ossetica]ANY77563.1 hypothetical protein BB934_04395 [Microvirga ossetica]
MKPAAYGFCLILLTLPVAAQSSETLVAKREACRIEARSRIVSKGKIEVDDYRRIVERRAAYVSQCLERSVVAHNGQPLPPKRVLDDAMDAAPAQAAVSPSKERRKTKVSSLRTVKAKTLKGKKTRISSRRRG